jgi:hypothetical protein
MTKVPGFGLQAWGCEPRNTVVDGPLLAVTFASRDSVRPLSMRLPSPFLPSPGLVRSRYSRTA